MKQPTTEQLITIRRVVFNTIVTDMWEENGKTEPLNVDKEWERAQSEDDAKVYMGFLDNVAKAAIGEWEKLNGWQPIPAGGLPAGRYQVAVATDQGFEAHILECDRNGNWLHEGEFTFQHGYYFEPKFYMPELPSVEGLVNEDDAE
jgi:hypothetical protein